MPHNSLLRTWFAPGASTSPNSEEIGGTEHDVLDVLFAAS
jgi:hypothetical protein